MFEINKSHKKSIKQLSLAMNDMFVDESNFNNNHPSGNLAEYFSAQVASPYEKMFDTTLKDMNNTQNLIKIEGADSNEKSPIEDE